jgi:pilus assembly protein CpaD
MTMRSKIAFVVLASALSGCATPGANPAARGLESVNQPVLTRASFTYDASAPGGYLAPEELVRLDGWFRSLELGYGDSVYLDGAYADTAREQVAVVAGTYGMLVSPAAPVTAGMVPGGFVRVIVARNRAEVPNCPNWSVPAQPNTDNATMSNFGCAVNSNLAAMVANPQDLFYGQDGSGLGDAATASKAVQYYRTAPPTGQKGLQSINSKGN